jgi:hypothetical protein
VGKPTLNKRERLRRGVPFDPAHVLGRLPPVQHVCERDRGAYEDVVHDEPGQPRLRAAICKARSLKG